MSPPETNAISRWSGDGLGSERAGVAGAGATWTTTFGGMTKSAATIGSAARDGVDGRRIVSGQRVSDQDVTSSPEPRDGSSFVCRPSGLTGHYDEGNTDSTDN